MTTLLATFFGVGFLRPAPGTWGSLVAVVVAGFLFYGIGPWAFIVPLVLIAIFGVPICVRYMQQTQKHDPSEVVIDEVLGQWIAIIPVFIFFPQFTFTVILEFILLFLLFRLLDITKPGIIGYFDRRNDAWGVMLDDVVAGLIIIVTMFIGVGGLWLYYGDAMWP